MPDALVSESFQKQYDDIAKRVLGPTGGAKYNSKYRPAHDRDIYVLISGVYEPEVGYAENEDLHLVGREVKFKSDGNNEQARYNFDPDQTGNTDSIVNTGKTVDVLNVDFDRDDPTAVEDTYKDNIYRVSMTYQVDDSENPPVRVPKWIAHVGGAGGTASRSYVQIVTVIGPAEYTGIAYDGPDGDVLDNSANIQVLGAASNPFQEGYKAFADKVTNSQGEDIYYIDGYLLG